MHDLGAYDAAAGHEAEAFRWFRRAAERGVADSQYNLGVMYQQGHGVGVDATEALFWFFVAARQDDADATAHATALAAQLTSEQVRQAQARASAFAANGP
jgi:localization factor PodJL